MVTFGKRNAKKTYTPKENNIEFTIDKNRCNSFTKYDYAYYVCRNNKPKGSLKRKNMTTGNIQTCNILTYYSID